MPHIERLPDDLVNKIAAGEVVERPASVVKELVENALDAEATQVVVDVEAGGKSLVRVRDDGHGMGREDAERAIERHATSKLRTLEDLQGIATHGFRGEALPSIASVSHLTLRTREEGVTAGTEVEVKHGRLVHVHDAGHPRGTTVEVRDLFGAVPARRKFLRADATETSHLAEVLTLLAVVRPQTGFVLTSSGRPLIQAPPVADLDGRIYQLFGRHLLEDLLRVDGGEDWCRVSGFVSRSDRPVGARPSLRLFVNGRAVRDRAVAKAVSEAYRAAGVADPRYEAILFLEAPLHMVDVNVHPAKTEVRFADSRTVWRAVEKAVGSALSEGTRRTLPRAETSRVAEAAETYLARSEPMAGAPERLFPQHPSLPQPPPTVLGQHRNTYIVATDGEELLLVDQHTAHERVRFERLLDGMEGRGVEAQRLLASIVLTLPPPLRPVLDAQVETLRQLGFDVEAFGGGSVRLGSVPAILGTRDPGPTFESILRNLLEREEADWIVASGRDRLAATVACHSSVRAGDKVHADMMAAIVRDLGRTRYPTLCPHGRPTVVRIPKDDVSRWFGRTGWRRQ